MNLEPGDIFKTALVTFVTNFCSCGAIGSSWHEPGKTISLRPKAKGGGIYAESLNTQQSYRSRSLNWSTSFHIQIIQPVDHHGWQRWKPTPWWWRLGSPGDSWNPSGKALAPGEWLKGRDFSVTELGMGDFHHGIHGTMFEMLLFHLVKGQGMTRDSTWGTPMHSWTDHLT